MSKDHLIIGGASGFWGEAPHATGQLLTYPGLDYLVYDYLAEITMSIMARARMKDAALGYATDFVSDAMARNLAAIAENKVKVLSNAGGVNPQACADALRAVVDKAGLDLKIAVVEGDDLVARASEFSGLKEMFDGTAFPGANKIASINAYLGAFPVADALDAGADIVITGRCADSALALAACIHHFGWERNDYDRLAAGSLAGHLLECGPQSTGGNFTDWEQSGNLAEIGYPVAEMRADGTFSVAKPPHTSGLVSPASVGEQMLYEIGDPQAYILPDVICDFSGVTISQTGGDRVDVAGAKGRAPTGRLKVSATYMDGYRAGFVFQFNGRDARKKARAFVDAGLERARNRLQALGAPDFTETAVELFGGRPPEGVFEEISVKAAVRHADARAVGLFLKEITGGALATPPGLHFFTGGGRPKPSPVVRLFSFLIDTNDVPVQVRLDGADIGYRQPPADIHDDRLPERPAEPRTEDAGDLVTCRLEDLAWARSGDKGNDANIGIIARRPEFLPWIWRAIDEAAVTEAFSRHLKGDVERFCLPGIHGMNILMHDVLGGGGIASLLNDAQGKACAQTLLSLPVSLPKALMKNSGGGHS
ncbi:acyclic terpene utilization AtuA family protein [Hoeflea sp. TYP-13]|uniref:acyclic terpene utilization AtuA family protein n=1 Tax=Hoeflea sp. TYP-13 TaxID=3230023 RepID=UPI0034C5F83F